MKHNFKNGDLVKYIKHDDAKTKETGYYPEINTIGKIYGVDEKGVFVLWPEGSTSGGAGYCAVSDVEFVPDVRGWAIDKSFVTLQYKWQRVCCPNCGRQRIVDENDDFNFCPWCGHKTLQEEE